MMGLQVIKSGPKVGLTQEGEIIHKGVQATAVSFRCGRHALPLPWFQQCWLIYRVAYNVSQMCIPLDASPWQDCLCFINRAVTFLRFYALFLVTLSVLLCALPVQDRVFVFFSDHGSPGILGMPTGTFLCDF